MTVDVFCVYWGDKYSEDYVHILKSSVERHTTIEHRFYCLSDREIEGVNTIPLLPGYEGWWNKLQLFDNNRYRMNNRKVYLDLDIVVTGNIDWLLTYDGFLIGNENCGIANKYEDRSKYVNSFMTAVMAWDSNECQFIWDKFRQYDSEIIRNFRGDGEYLDVALKRLIGTGKVDLIQRIYPGKFRSYKYECYDRGLIPGTTLVDFHGEPNPHQAISETVYPWGVPYEPKLWVAYHWRK